MTIKVTYNVTDVYVSESLSATYINVSYETPSGGGGGVWGDITGTLSNQADLQAALDAKVPYSGATGNVDLGEFELKAGQLELDQTPTGVAGVAVTRWNDSVGTIETTLKGGSVVLKHGRDMFERVVNKTGIQLTRAAYQAVRVSDAQGQRLAVQLAQANNDNNSADTIGLVVETIDNNQEGYIYTVGEIDGVNTTGSLQGETWVDGDVLYLSPTTAGRITNIKPVAPQHLVIIGYVVYAHANNGKIYVKVMNGWELGELHDVDTTGATNGQVLKYNGTIWTPSTDVGITGSGVSGQVAYWNGTNTQTGSGAFVFNDVNNRLGIGGAATNALTVHAQAVSDGIVLKGQTGINIFGVFRDGASANTAELYQWSGGNIRLAIRSTSNLSYFNGGNFAFGSNVDQGQLLQVNGTSLFTGASTFNSTITASSFIRTGGLSTQYLMADGSTSTLTNPVTGTGVSGQVAYWSGTGTQTGSNNLFWDATNNRLGIGTNAPASTLEVSRSVAGGGLSTILANPIFAIRNPANYGYPVGIVFRTPMTNGGAVTNIGSIWCEWQSDNNTYLGFATNTNGTVSEKMRIFPSGNVGINTGSTDSGQRLQVTGDTLLRGSGNTSATFGLTVQNSSSTNIFQVRNDGEIFAGIYNSSSFYISTRTYNATSGSGTAFYGFNTVNPTSGTAVWNSMLLQPTINQTGGANGITRGLYVNPTLTAAADWRSIEWSNNTGWGLYGAGTAANFLGGSLRVDGVMAQGGITAADVNLVMRRPLSGSVFPAGIYMISSVSSTSTTGASYFVTDATTQAASFTLPNLYHYFAKQTAFGAGSTVTNQFGYFVDGSLLGATNNYGFYGNIASGTGRWNLYMNGSANNYMAGSLGIGTTGLSNTNLSVIKNLTGLANVYGIFNSGSIRSDVTTGAQMFTSAPSIQNAVFTLAGLKHFEAVGISSVGSATITTQFGFYVESTLTGATTNYGFYSVIAAATGRWNLFMDGTANNFMRGSLLIGSSTTSTGEALQVNGTMKVSGASTFGGDINLSLNQNAWTRINVSNTTSGASSQVSFRLASSAGNIAITKFSASTSTYKILNANDGFIFNDTAGDLAIFNDVLSGSIKMAAGGSSTAQWTIGSNGDLTAADGENIIFGTTNGTKLGTATSQKIGFWNATPIVQPTTSIAEATFVENSGGTAVNVDSTFAGYTLQQIAQALKNMGILA